VREFQPAALGFELNKIYPWSVGSGTPASSIGAAALAAVVGNATVQANGALEAINRLGPLSFDLNSLRAFSANQTGPNSQQTAVSYTNIDQWAIGVAGLANSIGALGFTDKPPLTTLFSPTTPASCKPPTS
jgi:hypothetical protein